MLPLVLLAAGLGVQSIRATRADIGMYRAAWLADGFLASPAYRTLDPDDAGSKVLPQ